MNACPKCRGTTGYSLRVRTIGYVVHEGQWDGMHERITDDSNMQLIADKTVTCLDCKKRTLMKTIRAATMMLFLFALPLNAQVTQAKYDSLAARVAFLEKIVGDWTVRPDLSVPCVELPNGECQIGYRQRQLGVAADAAYGQTLPGFQAQLSGLASRLAIVERGAAASTGDLVLAKGSRLCIGAPCMNNVPAQIQLFGDVSAEILFSSNRNGANPQGAATHYGMVSLSPDAGLRLIQNSYHKSTTDWLVWPESSLPRTVLGFDHDGTLSLSQDKNGFIYPAQSLIVRLDDASKRVLFQSMKAGWTLGFCASPNADNNCAANYWTVPTTPQPISSVSPTLDLAVRSLTFVNDSGAVASMGVEGNNDKPQRQGRLTLRWTKDYPAEFEMEPGPLCCVASRGNAIVSQFMQWAQRTADGTGRSRLTNTIARDNAGGQYASVDVTTNDPSMSLGQSRAMPLVFNAGEGKGMYVVLHPSDNTVSIEDRLRNFSTGRVTLSSIFSQPQQ